MFLDEMDILLCVEDKWNGFDNVQTLAECFAVSTSEDDEEIAADCPKIWR